MSENESLSMFGREEEGGGVEVGGMGESGRDTVRFLSPWNIWMVIMIQDDDDADHHRDNPRGGEGRRRP